MNSPDARTSRAQKPKPQRSRSSWKFRAQAEACSKVSSGPRYRRTSGSAFIAAHGARSDSRQPRMISRSVLTSAMRPDYSAWPGPDRWRATAGGWLRILSGPGQWLVWLVGGARSIDGQRCPPLDGMEAVVEGLPG